MRTGSFGEGTRLGGSYGGMNDHRGHHTGFHSRTNINPAAAAAVPDYMQSGLPVAVLVATQAPIAGETVKSGGSLRPQQAARAGRLDMHTLPKTKRRNVSSTAHIVVATFIYL